MAREAREAPEVVARLLAANEAACRARGAYLRRHPPLFGITCARGSSDNAASFFKYVLEVKLRVVTASVGPSVCSVYRASPQMRDALFLAVSQSGRSPDLTALAEAARADGAITVGLVNDPASPLAQQCETVLPLHAGAERSVAATKSVIAAMAAGLQLAAVWSDDDGLVRALGELPEELALAARRSWTSALDLLTPARSLFVVGRGYGFAAAQEGALKLKETAGIHAEAVSAAELMHGPLTLAGPEFPVFLFSQPDATLPGLIELARTLRGQGVPVIAVGPAAAEATRALPASTGLDPLIAPIVQLQSFYLLAEALARARGRDPDSPPHLAKITETL